jgi:zinc transporter
MAGRVASALRRRSKGRRWPPNARGVEDAEEYAEHCQFLLEEVRAQVEEETNRNLYILTMFSVIFLPATLIASIWGMNVGGIPFSGGPNGFWMVVGLIATLFALVAIVVYRFRFRYF